MHKYQQPKSTCIRFIDAVSTTADTDPHPAIPSVDLEALLLVEDSVTISTAEAGRSEDWIREGCEGENQRRGGSEDGESKTADMHPQPSLYLVEDCFMVSTAGASGSDNWKRKGHEEGRRGGNEDGRRGGSEHREGGSESEDERRGGREDGENAAAEEDPQVPFSLTGNATASMGPQTLLSPAGNADPSLLLAGNTAAGMVPQALALTLTGNAATDVDAQIPLSLAGNTEASMDPQAAADVVGEADTHEEGRRGVNEDERRGESEDGEGGSEREKRRERGWRKCSS